MPARSSANSTKESLTPQAARKGDPKHLPFMLSRHYVLTSAALCVGVSLLLCSPRPALAASQLSSVGVSTVQKTGARVTLGFLGGLPLGWHFTGSGTKDVTVVLPGATQAPSINQLSYAGVNAITSVTISQASRELDVVLHLTAAVPFTSAASGDHIAIDVAPAAAALGTPALAKGMQMPVGGPADASARSYEVVPLKYADVSEVVGVLVEGQQIPPNDVFQPEGSIFTLPTSVNGPAAPQGQSFAYGNNGSQPQSVGERINDNIAIDRRLNAIILSGTPEQVAALKGAIAQIDVPLPSVMLECEVVELSENAARDLGLDFAGGQNAPVASGGVSILTGQPGGFNGAQYNLSLTAHLYATIAHGGGKILATPRILALNGTPAQILTGDALPLIQTTIYPGTPPTQSITTSYVAVGVNLQIQPRITSDGYVTSHIFAEVSSVTAYVPTIQGPVPQISLRQASTMATVADGTPFVIGGLLRDEEIQNMSKIPILGDLPIIGGLFRTRHDTTTRTNLYVIITPHIIQTNGSNLTVPPARLPHANVPGPVPYPTPAASPSPRA